MNAPTIDRDFESRILDQHDTERSVFCPACGAAADVAIQPGKRHHPITKAVEPYNLTLATCWQPGCILSQQTLSLSAVLHAADGSLRDYGVDAPAFDALSGARIEGE